MGVPQILAIDGKVLSQPLQKHNLTGALRICEKSAV